MIFDRKSDQVSFMGVQLVIRSITNIFPYKILLNTDHHSCTPTTQTSFIFDINTVLLKVSQNPYKKFGLRPAGWRVHVSDIKVNAELLPVLPRCFKRTKCYFFFI